MPKSGSRASGQNALYSRIYAGLQIFARSRLQAWGRFVATHQITILLLCCIVLCTLTYPTLSLYAWAAPDTTSDFFSFLRTSPTLDLLGAQNIALRRDLRLPWQGLDALVINGEDACWQRIPKYREITVQQILLGFPGGEGTIATEHGVLDRRALHAVHRFEQEVQHQLLSGANASFSCTSLDDTSTCFTLSPMAYWQNQDNAMLSDISLLATINTDTRQHLNLPLRHDDLFVGRTYSGSTMRKADYAVVSLFLQGNPPVQAISDLVKPLAIAQGLAVAELSRKEYRAVMKHSSEVKVRSSLWDDLFFFLGYAVVGLYIYITLRRLDKVHSRSGLVITGLVQMLASGIMSLSLCALAEYKINLVPWKLIPFLIVVLGVDNMFVLTTAVTQTSINLPVKERVAEGLGKTGLNIMVNLLVELLALGLLYIGVPTRVIREMVVFGAIALVVDFSMQMTYFVTVLSIDMQRLELADFLDQGSHKVHVPNRNSKNRPHKLPAFLESIFSSLSERRARSLSSVIIVGSNYLLYLIFGSEYFVPAFCSNLQYSDRPAGRPPAGESSTASEALWHLLGAGLSEAVHIHVNTPSILLLDTLHDRVVRPVNITQGTIHAILKFVVLPISGTTIALYLVLRQLLKGSELLPNDREEQRSKEYDSSPEEESTARQTILSCLAIESHRRADIELLAASANGRHTVSWVPSEGKLLVTPVGNGVKSISLPLKETLAGGGLVGKLALSDDGAYCAAATSTGELRIWDLQQPARHLAFPDAVRPASPIAHLFAMSTTRSPTSPPRSGRSASDRADDAIATFCVLRLNGQVEAWSAQRRQVNTLVQAVDEPCRMTVLECTTLPQPIITRLLGSGSLDIWSCHSAEGDVMSHNTLKTGATSRNTSQAACSLGGRLLVALGDSLGCISIWDVAACAMIYKLAAHVDDVRNIRLVCSTLAYCPSCGTEPQDAILIVSSSRTNLSVDRLTSGPTCTCSETWGTSLSRSTSNTGLMVPNGNHRSPSPRSVSGDEGKSSLAYPLSPHALRRLSHVSDRKKAEETARPLNGVESTLQRLDEDVFLHSRDTSLAISEDDSTSRLHWHHHHLGRLAIDSKTCWDVLGKQVIGVRKRRGPGGRQVLASWETWSLSLDKVQRDTTGQLATQSISVQDLLQLQTNAPSLDQQLPFDRVRHFFVTRDGSKVVSSLGNLVIVSSPVR